MSEDWLTDAARLRALIAVADAGGFSRAAAVLGVTQPTVSTLVAALERRLGVRLLERGRSGARPTAAGAALLPWAERVLAAAREAQRAVDAAAAGGRRRLVVAGGEALTTYGLPEALAALRRRLPGLEVAVVVGGPARVAAALRSGEASCALVSDRDRPAGVRARPYGEDALVLVAAPAHALAGAGPVGLDALAGHTLVSREPGRADRDEVDALLRRAGVAPAARFEVASLEAVKAAVQAGLGLAVVPGVAVARERARGDLLAVEVEGGLPALRYAVVAPRAAGDGLAEALRRELAAVMARLGG